MKVFDKEINYGILHTFLQTRFTIAGLILAIGLGGIPTVSAQQWRDVQGTAYAQAYGFLTANGVIAAQDEGRPHEPMPRAEAVKVLLDAREETRRRVDWFTNHLPRLPLFLDVARTAWYAPYVEAGFEAGIIEGFENRTLRPEDGVRVEEAVVMVMRMYKEAGITSDRDREWFAPLIRAALQKNLIAAPRSMAVGQAITRGQFLDIVYRMETVHRGNLAAFPGQTGSAVAAGASQGAEQADQPPSSGNPVVVAAPSSDQNEISQYGSDRSFSITIPSLDIRDLTVTHPADTLSNDGLLSVLHDGVGHLFSYPGRGGKIMVYGHSSGYSWDVSEYTKIFSKVHSLQSGDRVYLTFNGRMYVYQVTGQQKISPSDVRPFTGDGEELILYTCWPVGSNKSRLIIKASPVETVAIR